MDFKSIQTIIEKSWDRSAIPALSDYIRIPALSPGFDREWQASGTLLESVRLVHDWCRGMALQNTTVHVLTPAGRTPALLLDIGGSAGTDQPTALLYGHLDKQPEADGWDSGKGPWNPVLENDRLYGRGSADDGYAVFSAVIAISALQQAGIPHGRCVILIETGEESGSPDLEYYLEAQAAIIGKPDLIVCLDSGCGDYERLWVTTSLRGFIGAELSASLLTQAVHSGASGAVASSFRVLRLLLDRIETPETGDILLDEFHVDIPTERLDQIKKVAPLLADSLPFPLTPGCRLTAQDPETLVIKSTWKPTLSYIGADGFPSPETAGNILRPRTTLALSFRTPPPVDTEVAAQALVKCLESDPPYGADVTCRIQGHARGWDMPALGRRLEDGIRNASASFFNNAPGHLGEGGTIPFMTLLADRFPAARFLVTGVLGPHSNAHGPNEFLHIPYVKKLTCAIAAILAGECRK